MNAIKLIFLVLTFVYLTNAHCNIVTKNFYRWQKKYNKTYSMPSEVKEALSNFQMNYMKTLRHQHRYYTYRSNFIMRLNKFGAEDEKTFLNGAQFGDLPVLGIDNEFEDFIVGPNNISPRAFNLPVYPPPPPSLDYRDLGYVTRVEDQGYSCSSCYAFAAACGIEGQVAKKYGTLNSLSSQHILDCSGIYGNVGCVGGSIGISYKYVLLNQGISNQTSYPYTGSVNTCAYNSSLLAQRILSYTYVTGDENYLKSVLAAIGPIPVGMKGSLDSFYYYSNGIYDDASCTGLIDHAVCLVGYGTDNTTSPPKNYWIAKNSWSTDWGENGYFRMKMGVSLKCGRDISSWGLKYISELRHIYDIYDKFFLIYDTLKISRNFILNFWAFLCRISGFKYTYMLYILHESFCA